MAGEIALTRAGALDLASVTQVNSSATSTSLLAANRRRKGVIVQNTDANALYLKYGATAATTSFTVKIPGNDGYWEMPQPIFNGAIDGIWAADGSGVAAITEF